MCFRNFAYYTNLCYQTQKRPPFLQLLTTFFVTIDVKMLDTCNCVSSRASFPLWWETPPTASQVSLVPPIYTLRRSAPPFSRNTTLAWYQRICMGHVPDIPTTRCLRTRRCLRCGARKGTRCPRAFYSAPTFRVHTPPAWSNHAQVCCVSLFFAWLFWNGCAFGLPALAIVGLPPAHDSSSSFSGTHDKTWPKIVRGQLLKGWFMGTAPAVYYH